MEAATWTAAEYNLRYEASKLGIFLEMNLLNKKIDDTAIYTYKGTGKLGIGIRNLIAGVVLENIATMHGIHILLHFFGRL